jgi:putative colanic acid biosynthesis glycosyltransferase
VAKSLAASHTAAGHEVEFAYGYAKRGLDVSASFPYPATRLATRTRAAANLLRHSLDGGPEFSTGAQISELTTFLSRNDVVHLHILHSYFLNMGVLVRAIASLDTPPAVVFTAHDHWAVTGRCAQPAACRRWEAGCGNCPDLSAYPPARLDRSAHFHVLRRRHFDRLNDCAAFAFVSCAQWLADDLSMAFPRHRIDFIPNSTDPSFWNAAQRLSPAEGRNGAVFLCHNLQDRRKTDWSVLAEVSEFMPLTVVGSNAPNSRPQRANYVPAITDREFLATMLGQFKHMIFTSKIDYFPLTIVEGLLAGLNVHAVESNAAWEFARHPALTIYPDEPALVEGLKALSGDTTTLIKGERSAFEKFNPRSMSLSYMNLYRDLMNAA